MVSYELLVGAAKARSDFDMSAILAALALNRTVAYYPTFNAPRSILRTCAFSVTTLKLRTGILRSRNQSRKVHPSQKSDHNDDFGIL